MAQDFLIIDGHNLAYRSYFALAHITRGDAPPTQALLGFIKTHRSLLRIWNPTHQVVVFDGGLSAQRLEQCPEYKAQRPPMPDDLRSQFPLIQQYLDCAAVPALRIPGQEADDIIAALALRAAEEQSSVKVFSSDKDLCQLIGPRVHLINPARPEVLMDASAARAKFGVPPERLGEWLALTGDASDNIRGVPGIGPVTATKLILRFESIDSLYEHLEEIPERPRESLRANRPLVERNRMMVRLHTQIPDLPEWQSLVVGRASEERLSRFLVSMNLRSLLPQTRQPDLFD
ncbi:MAG: 5'-3' exonuclease H3TH domain-containing protein [Kiritimatiellia bacterium]|nr:5'-3' exonuclease H3TH domain-containing protein [Kiritimatiellia bacterium]